MTGSEALCKVCASGTVAQACIARDMMFGMDGTFIYGECAECHSLQLLNIPDSLSAYYPANYYAHGTAQPLVRPSAARRLLQSRRFLYALYGRDFLGWAASRIGALYFDYDLDWFRYGGVSPSSAILDVGCGEGALLRALYTNGFRNLHGIDPYLTTEVDQPGLRIQRKSLAQADGTFTMVMAHHALEHMADPLEALLHMKRLCRAGGSILLRLPVANCRSWLKYKANWFALDAPRHLVIPSEQGMRALVQRAGMSVSRVVYDCDEVYLLGSEQYSRGITLYDPRSYWVNRGTDIFSPSDVNMFKEIAKRLNETGEGDSACYYVRATASDGQGGYP
jgi:hypothetical protein